jgi:periodic tryptophan protein 1
VEHEGPDEYITLPGAAEDEEGDEVKATDLLVVAAKAEEEGAALEVWLFEEPDIDGSMNAYVHHDIPLPSFPLAVAWMNFNARGVAAVLAYIHMFSLQCCACVLPDKG